VNQIWAAFLTNGVIDSGHDTLITTCISTKSFTYTKLLPWIVSTFFWELHGTFHIWTITSWFELVIRDKAIAQWATCSISTRSFTLGGSWCLILHRHTFTILFFIPFKISLLVKNTIGFIGEPFLSLWSMSKVAICSCTCFLLSLKWYHNIQYDKHVLNI
jgi:hypothetical protein